VEGRGLADIVRQFDRQSDVLPGVPWFTDPARVREILDFAEVSRGDRVLEVGCGIGVVLEQASRVAGRLFGVDASPRMLEEARERVPAARIARAVGERLPFRDGAFDVAYCRSTLHHVLDPSRVLGEMARVVRQGGRVAVNDTVTSELPEWSSNHNEVERLRDPSHGRMVTGSELLGLYERAGINVSKIVERRYTRSLTDWLDVTSPAPETRAAILARFEAWLEADTSGLHVRRGSEAVQFDHTQWSVLGVRP